MTTHAQGGGGDEEGALVHGAKTEAWGDYLAGLPAALAALHASPPDDVLPLAQGRQVHAAELVAVLREQSAPPLGPAQTLAIRDDRYGAGVIAAAWRHTVHRQVRAVLVLIDAGLDAEAQANARSALKHAVELTRLSAAADTDHLEAALRI